VINLLIGLMGAVLATNPAVATSNLLQQTTGLPVNIPDPNDPVEQEFKKVMEEDDTAMADIDKMIQDNAEAVKHGTGVSNQTLNDRIEQKLGTVRQEYEDFLRKHPDHARAHIAFGSFLNDAKDEDAAKTEFQKALQLDPNNAAGWNDLANTYSHTGPTSKMFEDYQKAIDINPREPVYYENLATVVYVYRKDAQEYYHLTNDTPVFDKAMHLYEQAFALDPTNFALASELAESYYGIKPTRTDDALNAWTNALKIATTEVEQQGVYIHFARFKLNAGRFDEARADLSRVTDPQLDDLKNRLVRNLNEHDYSAATNHLPALRVECPDGRKD
jgi:tetratricopeptide (TPR) repeat protein